MKPLLKRDQKMDPKRAKALTDRFLKAEDLHWICPKCKIRLEGTLEELEKGCDCG